MVAKAITLLPKSTAPFVGAAVELPKMSGPRSFQVNLEGRGQVAATLQIQCSLDGNTFFSVRDIALGSNLGVACKGFYLSGDYGPLTCAALLDISGEDASVEVLTA